MRYDVKKFLFIGLKEDRAAFFEEAQSLGIVHFIQNGSVKMKEIPPDVQNATLAIKILRGLPNSEQEEVDEYALADGIINKILEMKQSLDKLEEEARVNRLEIERVEVFGDFSLELIASLEKETHRRIQFYFSKEGYFEENPLPEGLIYVASAHGLDYFFALNKEPKQFPKMVEMHIQHPLGVLLKKQKEIAEEYHHIEQRLKTYAKYNTFLHHALVFKLNGYNLQAAKQDVKWEVDGSLFAVEGWVPENKLDRLLPLVESLDVHLEEVGVDEKDVVPTYLENTGFSKMGEDLVNIYDTPSHTDKDPSLWVLFFFSLFFAFIVGDAGYGLLFLLTALYIRYRYTLNSVGMRAWRIMTVLASACIIWGLLTTSFFGLQFAPDSPIRKISLMTWMVEKKAAYLIRQKDPEWQAWVKKFPELKTVEDRHEFIQKASTEKDGKVTYEAFNSFSDNIMFELAIFIGVVHTTVSLLRYIKRTPTAIGWIIFLIGAYLYFPGYLGVNSLIHYIFGVPQNTGTEGLYLMFGGITLATGIGIYKNRLLGILEPATVIQLFGDIMSYLRLYALGLAGSMMTGTMLDLAASTNFVIGGLILLLGHLVNMVLSIMGGTIHGLRLNFLEWYHYSFEGGGKPFNPLRKLTID